MAGAALLFTRVISVRTDAEVLALAEEGVRRAAGEHAKRLNQMSDAIELEEDGEEAAELQEKLGHTPLEVLGGALLGILVPMIIV